MKPRWLNQEHHGIPTFKNQQAIDNLQYGDVTALQVNQPQTGTVQGVP
jgi:hypothetical protein